MFLKIVSRIFTVIGALTVLLLILILCALIVGYLMIDRDIIFEENERFPSPDGRVDAVLMGYDAGATTSYSNSLYLVPSGFKITKWDVKIRDKYIPVFVADHIEGLEIQWIKAMLLEIRYNKARINKFCNQYMPLPNEYNYVVDVREIPIVTDKSLSKHNE